MDQPNGSPHVDAVEDCVKVLQDLEQELQAASSAIACNKLADFEESLWRQESLCCRLKRTIPAIRSAISAATSTTVLRLAASHLRAQSQVYEKLVTQSTRSTAILQHLCSLYRNAGQHPGGALHRAISREA